MCKLKIGLLPFYLKLYDDCCPKQRQQVEAFAEIIREEYAKRKIEVVHAPVCCIKSEFADAVKRFESAGVEAIVTLHLAYSPSLESADVLANTDLPIVILDTTPDFAFGFGQTAEAIMANHGIHGVQDMCNLLIRKGKNFMIEAGHWQESDVIDRTVARIHACKMFKTMRKSRVGIIGKPFDGMGDFSIDFATLKKTIGFDVISLDNEKFKYFLSGISETEIDSEIQNILAAFTSGDYSEKSMRDSVATCLATRTWLQHEKLNAFSVNFLNVTKASGIPVVPFLETSKAMSRGIGYAGEGDVLTAALVGTLMTVFNETTFSEMFCPDWKGNRIFLSHMGEVNPEVCTGKAMLHEKLFPFTDADNPVVATGCLKPGNAHLINLAPGPQRSYSLIVAPVNVCDSENKEAITNAVRGWLTPSLPISDFLTAYSKLGGTHHLAISYNADENILRDFAALMNWNFYLIN